jgi:ubiquinone/menaquinone biosynthesis C-methylase UbiE
VPIDLDEYRKTSHETWNRVAPNWASEREFLRAGSGVVSERLVVRLDPQPGDTVLELAAGTGDTGFLVASSIGESGRLISTDFAPSMVEAARQGGATLGLDNVEYRVLDAENMDLDDSSVDRVVCRWGYMLIADPAAALAETRRVLKDGGRLAFAVWAAPEKNPWASIPGMVLVQRGYLPPPEPGAPGIFSMADPERIRALVVGAGFGEPEIEQVELSWPIDSADDHWNLMVMKLSGPLADAIGRVGEEEREEIRSEVRSGIEPVIEEHGSLPGVTHVVTTS